MKKFLLKISFFFLFVISTYLLIFVYLKHSLKNKINNSEVIILGDSHSQYLNFKKTFNYSISGAPYILHYHFIKTFKNQIKNKKVVIAVGFHNISKLYENRFNITTFKDGSLPMVNEELNAYNLIVKSYNYAWRENNRLFDIVSKNKINTLYNLRFNQKIVNNYKTIGNTITYKKTLEKHYNPNYTYSDTIQIKYLNLILNLLKNNNCKIYLFNTPITDYYYKYIPINIKTQYSSKLDELKTEYLDLNNLFKNDINFHVLKMQII